MTNKVRLNKTALARLKPEGSKQAVFWDQDLTGFGVRVSPGREIDGIRSPTYTYFLQGRLRGTLIKVTIGKHPTFTPESARKVAREWLGKMAAGIDPRITKDPKTKSATFGNMMLGYCEWMESQGKVTAAKVRREVEKDIGAAFPRLWKKAANQITPDDCDRIIEALETAKPPKPRQADKIRSYMKTAFRKAINAKGKRRYPEGLRIADVRINPCADIEKVAGSSKARERALSVAEIRAYWKHVNELPEPRRSILRLHVLSGGQRIDQLCRVTLADVDRDAMTMMLLDGKGRRTTPYRHYVPLLPETLDAIDTLTGTGAFIMSCDGGTRPISDTYMRDSVATVREAMQEAGELENGHFTPGSIRATVETRLVAKPYRVGVDVLAQLLSHGLGGVQAKHYQKHNYYDEKLEALQALLSLLEPGEDETGNVVPIKGHA